MGKKLSEMTMEELWQLFPIILTKPQEAWAKWFAEEKDVLSALLPEDAIINHIGSTAIKGIWAKPIIDILVELKDFAQLAAAKDILVANGYIFMCESENRISLNKGYTEDGFDEKVFHIHMRLAGDNEEIAFRDYMNNHPDAAREYEKLKLSLWKEYEYNRDGYTDAKTEFVEHIKHLQETDRNAFKKSMKRGQINDEYCLCDIEYVPQQY